MKRDIQDELCSNTDSVAKKLKEESKITFRFEGNKKQFQFNSDFLAAKVKLASVALGKRKLDLVKTHLEELDSEIKKRNKRIRLTDKSAAGWDLVKSIYLTSWLAGQRSSRGPFVHAANANRKRSHPSKVIHNSNHLPQPPRLLANIHQSAPSHPS